MDNNIIQGAGTTVGVDNYTVALSVRVNELVENAKYSIRFESTNTGASDIDINGIGAVALLNADGTAVGAGAVQAGQYYDLTFDGASLRLPPMGASLGYLEYVATLNQTGTNAPVATVLKNDLGAPIVWSRDSTGFYKGTLNAAFTVNKTTVTVGNVGQSDFYTVVFFNGFPNTIDLFVSLLTNIGGGNDDELFQTPILIRVYP